MTIIGFDFSINKPSACVLHDNSLHFISWPYDLSEEIIKVYEDSGVKIVKRTDNKYKGDNISTKMRYEVENSQYLASLIRESLEPYFNNNTYIAFEGLSYASSGDVVLQLGGYKYMLMNELSKYVPLDNMFTYSPITVKSTAGCAKRGLGKKEMIDEFIKSSPISKLRIALFEHTEKFLTPRSKNYIIHLDDLVDAFWVLQTLKKKEGI